MTTFIGLSNLWKPDDWGQTDLTDKQINYLKKKHFSILLCDDTLLFKDLIDISNKQNTHYENKLSIIIGKPYIYLEREFIRKNYAFYKFIEKIQHYYKNKFKFYRSPKFIVSRMIHGK